MPAISELPALSAVAPEDLLPVVDDPAGAPTTKRASVADLLQLAWPVGSVFVSAVDTDPALLLGFGTWVAFGAGRVLVGLDPADPDFDALLETGGAKRTPSSCPTSSSACGDALLDGAPDVILTEDGLPLLAEDGGLLQTEDSDMAADYIVVNRTKQLGNSLVRAADLLRELRELIDKLSDTSDHSNDGASYTVMETNFGLPAGQGANTASLIGLIRDILNTNVTVAGADRLARLDEFCGRLAGQ